MSRFRAVIFDWDGTLVDSLDHITASLAAAARDLSLPVRSDYELRDIIGLGLVEALQKLYPGITRAEMAALRDAYGRYFFSATATPQGLYAGIADLLAQLRQAGPVLAVATGKSRKGLDSALVTTHLGPFFHLTRCADETRSKPHPQMLKEILLALELEPREAVMIGDTVYDLEMAARMGMPSVGVTWGVHEASALAAHEPLRIVNEVAELGRFLADNVRSHGLDLEGVVHE